VRFSLRAIALASLLLVAACATRPVPPPEQARPAPAPIPAPPPVVFPPPSPVGPNAVATGVKLEAPRVLKAEEAARALQAFRASCPALNKRRDKSGLTLAGDWQALCAEAATLDPSFAPGFFFYNFDWVKIGDGRAFATGYYEPEIEGSRTPLPGYVPIYRVPPDLIRCTKPDGTGGRGRIDETGTCTLYFTRPDIEDGALAGKGLELAWAADPVDLFFLEIQGSGRIHFPDGSVMHIGYADQNGRDYVAIGRLLRDRAILPPGGANMESIKSWIRANPDEGRALMRENLSYIFFRELTGSGPLGSLNVPVTPHVTVAADPNYVPLGAPIYIHKADRHDVDGLWVAQDTGGAIKGPNRFDTFWGAGPEAVATAGGMSASGEALILIPKGTAARAIAQP
jgi:membrane-bound lytic murein transglycosylase A